MQSFSQNLNKVYNQKTSLAKVVSFYTRATSQEASWYGSFLVCKLLTTQLTTRSTYQIGLTHFRNPEIFLMLLDNQDIQVTGPALHRRTSCTSALHTSNRSQTRPDLKIQRLALQLFSSRGLCVDSIPTCLQSKLLYPLKCQVTGTIITGLKQSIMAKPA